ncbi:hypothetical protein C5167_009369 [Papaver somniferum]|uniref:Uncharacterized protein n=1 Tax=Papaver somniferum TaxID=3469 RepID=A0A4Y7K0A3_PAPSO|nr:hypothetical protein C5167_009369 [Papaver somniferum]
MASNNNDSQNQQSTYLGKAMEVCNGGDTKNQWDKLPNDMVEMLLGLLPTEDIFWCQMVDQEKAWIELPAAQEYTSSGNWWINDVPII